MADEKKNPDLSNWPKSDPAVFTPADEGKGYVLVRLSEKALTVDNKRDASRIFWEWDLRHPNNQEALVVKGTICKVFYTDKVRQAVAQEILEIVRDSRTQPTPTPPNVADILGEKSTSDAVNKAVAEAIAKQLPVAVSAPTESTATAPKK